MVHAFHMLLDGNGYFLIYALTDPENVGRVRDAIMEEIRYVKTELTPLDRYQQAVSQVDYMFREQVESLTDRSRTYAIGQLLFNDYGYYTSKSARLSGYTPKDIQKLAQDYLVQPQVFIFNGK